MLDYLINGKRIVVARKFTVLGTSEVEVWVGKPGAPGTRIFQLAMTEAQTSVFFSVVKKILDALAPEEPVGGEEHEKRDDSPNGAGR